MKVAALLKIFTGHSYKQFCKRLLMLLLLSMLGFCAYRCTQPSRLYLKFGKDKYGSYIVEVPYNIVKKQDCAAYKAWAEKASPSFFAQNACPWEKPIISGEIGKFIVNDIKFNIPRKYLYLENISGGTSDGEHSKLFLAFIYPDITPLTAADWSKVNEYKITLDITSSAVDKCPTIGEGKQCDFALYEYQFQTDSSMDRISGAQPQLIKKDAELGMDLYSWTDKYGTASGFYVRGDDPWRPDYWMRCGAVRCQVIINYADNHVFISYKFHIDTLLARHDELRNKIIDLLDEWSGKKESEG